MNKKVIPDDAKDGNKKKKPMALAQVLETLGVPPAQQWVPGENGPGPSAPANTESIAK